MFPATVSRPPIILSRVFKPVLDYQMGDVGKKSCVVSDHHEVSGEGERTDQKIHVVYGLADTVQERLVAPEAFGVGGVETERKDV